MSEQEQDLVELASAGRKAQADRRKRIDDAILECDSYDGLFALSRETLSIIFRELNRHTALTAEDKRTLRYLGQLNKSIATLKNLHILRQTEQMKVIEERIRAIEAKQRDKGKP